MCFPIGLSHVLLNHNTFDFGLKCVNWYISHHGLLQSINSTTDWVTGKAWFSINTGKGTDWIKVRQKAIAGHSSENKVTAAEGGYCQSSRGSIVGSITIWYEPHDHVLCDSIRSFKYYPHKTKPIFRSEIHLFAVFRIKLPSLFRYAVILKGRRLWRKAK